MAIASIDLRRFLPIAALAIVGCGPNSKVGTPRLDIGPQDVVTQTVYQRETREIAASGGSLCFQLGDITGGTVLVSVLNRSGEPLIDRREMRAGDITRANVSGQEYVFSLDRLVNLLTGNDYATLSVMRAEKWNQVAIERLLNRIETSGLTFIRNGTDHNGSQMAMVLREKLSLLNQKNPSTDEFIDTVASNSMTTDEAYQVRLTDGRIIQMGDWLRNKGLVTSEPSPLRSGGLTKGTAGAGASSAPSH